VAGRLASDTGLAFQVDKSSPVPLYTQLKTLIIAQIESGQLLPGAILPSEFELMEVLGVSRPTVRQALSELAAEGYIDKQRGRGSFVAHRKIEGQFLNKLQTFEDEMRHQRLTPSTRMLSLRRVSGIPRVNDRLGLPHSDELVELTRLRFADGVPVVYVDTHLPFAPFVGLLNADLEKSSLYETLERDHGTRVSRVTRTIEASAARASEAELLEVRPGSPICLVRTTAYAADNRAVEFSVASYRGDMSTFTVELYR